MITIRAATVFESSAYLLDAPGFIAEDESGELVGHIGYIIKGDIFEAVAWATYTADSTVAARLRKKLISKARSLGFVKIHYVVLAPNLDLLRAVGNGKVSILSATLEETI